MKPTHGPARPGAPGYRPASCRRCPTSAWRRRLRGPCVLGRRAQRGAVLRAQPCHRAGPQIATLNNAARDFPGVEIRTDCTAVCLLREGEAGRVSGLTIEGGGGLSDVVSRGGVVIASGGFSRSEEFFRKFVPHQARSHLTQANRPPRNPGRFTLKKERVSYRRHGKSNAVTRVI
ncbi:MULTISPECIES: FAD-binding protein [unclassified Variovorax]|uniref:FAD-binding protein n=1 Tax=Variovorax sp. WDL1 TaxID=207745 RepID=UPI0011AF581F